jgi:hypothetical protein
MNWSESIRSDRRLSLNTAINPRKTAATDRVRIDNSPLSAVMASTVLVIPRRQMVRLLQTEPTFSDRFITHLLVRNARLEADPARSVI